MRGDLRPAPAAIHTIDADAADPEVAARAHDAVAANGLDLALLGLGMNGHVGLNEPGSGPDSPTRVVGTAAAVRLLPRSTWVWRGAVLSFAGTVGLLVMTGTHLVAAVRQGEAGQ